MITKTKFQKTLSGNGFMRNDEGIKIDVEYKINVYQKFIDTGSGEIPGIHSHEIAIHFLVARIFKNSKFCEWQVWNTCM